METRYAHGLLYKIATISSAGIVVAIFTIIASVSFASLIFTPPLDAFVASGIKVALTTAVVVGALVALTSSYNGIQLCKQDSPNESGAIIWPHTTAANRGQIIPIGDCGDAVFASLLQP